MEKDMVARKEVAKKGTTALAEGAVSFEDDAGGGFEEADRDSYAIPFCGILQALSPQLDETKGEYIEDAKAGMFFNNVTDETFDGKAGLMIIPCHYRRAFVEWKRREDGGGLVAEHTAAEGAQIHTTRDERNRDITSTGTQLVDTRIHYALIVNLKTGATATVVITMSSTQTKKSKKWMTVMQNLLKERADGSMYNPAMFASMFKVTSVPESNEQGSWHGWKIVHDHFLDETNAGDQTLYQTARAFRNAIKSGEATVQHDQDAGAEGANVDKNAGGGGAPPDREAGDPGAGSSTAGADNSGF